MPGIVAVSAVSLIGGASLGPEKALGSMGGGAGTWIGQRRNLSREDSQVCTLSGFGGAYGGLFSSTVIVVMFILELARPGGRRFAKTLATEIVASSVSFGIYFAIAGAVFLYAYQVPQYAFEDWQLLAGVPLGLFAVLVVCVVDGCGPSDDAAVRIAEAPWACAADSGRCGVRGDRRGTALDDVHR